MYKKRNNKYTEQQVSLMEKKTAEVSASTRTKKDIAYAGIKDMIIGGRFTSRDPLVERQLCQELGVSRTPVREALQALVNDGLLENVEGKGIFLHQVSLRDLIELYELRLALEALATYLFVERATDAEVKHLREIFEQADAALREDEHEKFMEYDMQFHGFIAAESKNQRLRETIESNYDRIHMMALSVRNDPELCQIALENHTAIIQAAEQRDKEAASKAMVRHIEQVKAYHQAHFYLYA